jgi:hypothetical protein
MWPAGSNLNGTHTYFVPTDQTGNALLSGNLLFQNAGDHVFTPIASGSAAGANSYGTVTLVAGTATVSTTSVTSVSQVALTITNVAGSTSIGRPYISSKTAGTSFTITSAQLAMPASTQSGDTSTILWQLIN